MSDVSWFIDRSPDYSLLEMFAGINIENCNSTIRIISEQFVVSKGEDIDDCAICMETRENDEFCRLNCKHHFCSICIQIIMRLPRAFHCPLCRVKVDSITSCKSLKNSW
jgi:hypothetical protein